MGRLNNSAPKIIARRIFVAKAVVGEKNSSALMTSRRTKSAQKNIVKIFDFLKTIELALLLSFFLKSFQTSTMKMNVNMTVSIITATL
jgi:hypothetical protein